MPKPRPALTSEEVQEELRFRIGEYDPIQALVERQSRQWFGPQHIRTTENGGVDASEARAIIAENVAKNAADIALMHKVVSNLRHRPTQRIEKTTTHILQDNDDALLRLAGVDVRELTAGDDEFDDIGAGAGGTDKAH